MTPLLILDLAAKSLVILLLAFAAQALWRRASAGRRCLVWLAAFISLLALPATLFIKPYWAPATSSQSPVRLTNFASEAVPLPSAATAPETTTRVPPKVPAWWQQLSLLQIASVFWLAGLLSVLGHRLLGAWQLRRLRAQSSACEDVQIIQQVAVLARSLGIRRSVEVLTTTAMAVPVTWGISRPVVLLPHEALTWNEEALHAALVHELGHIRHWDAASRWLATFTCALHWWNPLAWAAARSWRSSQEQAADDVVLLRGGASAQNYAMQLLRAARSFQESHFLRTSLLAMARPSTLEARLASIMDTARSRRRIDHKSLFAAALAILLVLAGVSSMSLQGQPAKPQAAAEPAEPPAKDVKYVATVVKVLKAPSGHFTGHSKIISGKILSPQEITDIQKDPAVELLSTPRVVTMDRQKGIVTLPVSQQAGAKMTLLSTINGDKVNVFMDILLTQNAASNRSLKSTVDIPAGKTALLVLPPAEKEADIVLYVTPVILDKLPPEATEETASKIVFPEVKFTHTTLDAVIYSLREDGRKLAPDHKGINILVVGQSEARLNLDLEKASLKEVLNSVASQSGLELRFESTAAILAPRGTFLRRLGAQFDLEEPAPVIMKAASIKLPPMDFYKADFADVVAYLHQEARQVKPGADEIEIILDDQSQAAHQLISFSLHDLSFMDLLHYACMLGDYAITAKGKALTLTPAAR